MIIYHGSKNIITKPEFGKGNIANDYGLGFYCTENIELAKEWACSDKVTNGYVTLSQTTFHSTDNAPEYKSMYRIKVRVIE